MYSGLVSIVDSIPLYPGWLFFFFYGLFLIKLTKYRKSGKAIIIIFSMPVLYIVICFILFLLFVSPESHPGGVAFTP